MAGLDPAIHDLLRGQGVDARVKPGHDEEKTKGREQSRPFSFRAPTFFTSSFRGEKREPGIHTHDGGYGFRACAKRRIPEMTTVRPLLRRLRRLQRRIVRVSLGAAAVERRLVERV